MKLANANSVADAIVATESSCRGPSCWIRCSLFALENDHHPVA